jgi:4-methyl-5(b-hydroxyethyl)-thiazole monophosphate biosynthesis
VISDMLYEEADYDSCDMIVLPGGLPGAFGLQDHVGLGEKIKQFAEADKPLAAICAAPLVLGYHGVLNRRKATIYPGMESHLTGGVAVDKRVVCDGNLITAQGPSIAIDFAVAIVEFFKGKEVALDLRKDLLLER